MTEQANARIQFSGEGNAAPLAVWFVCSNMSNRLAPPQLRTLAMASSPPSRRHVVTSSDAEVDGPAVLSMSDLRLAQCYQFVEEVWPITSKTFKRANHDLSR